MSPAIPGRTADDARHTEHSEDSSLSGHPDRNHENGPRSTAYSALDR